MASLNPPVCDFGTSAVDFVLPGVDGQNWSLKQCMGSNGILVMFICNHCPYVKAVIHRILRNTAELKSFGISSVAISSNDFINYPEDSFKNMQALAKRLNFGFPYLLDESQQIAKKYTAVCTPDFFGYNAKYELQYRGRLDASRKETLAGVKRDLFNAMQQISQTGYGPKEQIASVGCSIKWK